MSTILNRLFGTSSTGSPAQVPTATEQRTTGPLAPQFDRIKSGNQSEIRYIQQQAQTMADALRAMRGFFRGVNFRGSEQFFGYESKKPMEMRITQQLPGDRADMVVAMFVSGHDYRHEVEHGTMTRAEALAKVDLRAKDNSYNIKITRPDKSTETMTGIKANGSRVTLQDISITNMQPGVTTIEVWPDGSFGTGGYVEGRKLLVTYQPPAQSTPR